MDDNTKGVGTLGLKPSPDAEAELTTSWDYELAGNTDCSEGCVVEPDGHCAHGYMSAALTAGLI